MIALLQNIGEAADEVSRRVGALGVVRELGATIRDVTGLQMETQGKILASLAIIAVLWVLRWIAIRFSRQVEDIRARYRWRKIITYVTVLLGFLLVGPVWVRGVGAVATYLGFVSAGLAIALKDPLVNVVGWLHIMWRRPFVVGDRIQIEDHAGDVIDLRLFQFTLLEIGRWVDADQSTGRIIHVPNGKVFQEPLANYTRGFSYIWNELPVLVTFESDWQKAKRLLAEIANRHAEKLSQDAEQRVLQASRRFMIFYTKLTPTVYTSIVDSGVLLTIRYLTEPRRRRGSAELIWEDILRAFAEHDDIDFAYPTQRMYLNMWEGKPESKAPPPTLLPERETELGG